MKHCKYQSFLIIIKFYKGFIWIDMDLDMQFHLKPNENRLTINIHQYESMLMSIIFNNYQFLQKIYMDFYRFFQRNLLKNHSQSMENQSKSM